MDSANLTERCISPVDHTVTTTGETGFSDTASEATRYMAAAMYLNSRLCSQVLTALEDDPYRAIGPNYGVDLPIVVEHARHARSLRHRRDFLLAITWLLPLASVDFREDLLFVVRQPELFSIFVSYYWGLLLAIFGLSGTIVFGERLYRERLWVGRRLSRRRFQDHARASLRTLRLLPKEVRDRCPINAVISGGYAPFIGCGGSIGAWSFCIRTDVGREEHGNQLKPITFGITELYDAVTAAVRELQILDLRIEDRLYVDGSRIRGDQRFLPSLFGRPRQHVEDSVIAEMIGRPSESVRHYRCFQVVDWRGEMVLTMSLRFHCQGSMLFIEANYNLLTPPRREYLAVDSIAPWPGLKLLINDLLHSFFLAPWYWLVAPLVTVSIPCAPVIRFFAHRKCRRQIRENPSFNYGSTISFRERAASGNYRIHFQQLDKEMNCKLIEGMMLDSIVKFFDDHNIDTSSLRERKMSILNNGILISGGTVTADSIAAGKGAKAGLVDMVRMAGQISAVAVTSRPAHKTGGGGA